MPCSEPYPETFLCACFCPCREGGRANSMWIFVQLVLVLLGEVQSLPCQSSCMIACPGRKNRVCHSSKCTELTGQRQKFFFSFFFSESKKLLQLPHCQKYQKVTSMSHVTLGEDGGWWALGWYVYRIWPSVSKFKGIPLSTCIRERFPWSQKFHCVARGPVKDCFIMRRTGEKVGDLFK